MLAYIIPIYIIPHLSRMPRPPSGARSLRPAFGAWKGRGISAGELAFAALPIGVASRNLPRFYRDLSALPRLAQPRVKTFARIRLTR